MGFKKKLDANSGCKSKLCLDFILVLLQIKVDNIFIKKS